MFEFFAPIFEALNHIIINNIIIIINNHISKDNQGYERIIFTKVIRSKWTGNSTDIKNNSVLRNDEAWRI